VRELRALLDAEKGERTADVQFSQQTLEDLTKLTEQHHMETEQRVSDLRTHVMRLEEAQKTFPPQLEASIRESRDNMAEQTTAVGALKKEIKDQQLERIKGDTELQGNVDHLRTEFENFNRSFGQYGREAERNDKELREQMQAMSRSLDQGMADAARDLESEVKERDAAVDAAEKRTAATCQEIRALVAAERSTRSDADEKLRQDCIDAIQKEITARQDGDKSVIDSLTKRLEDMSTETKQNKKDQETAMENLESAVLEMREALDSLESAAEAMDEEEETEELTESQYSRSGFGGSRGGRTGTGSYASGVGSTR